MHLGESANLALNGVVLLAIGGATLSVEIYPLVKSSGIVAASVLSGDRNFEGRVSQDVRANYLASPPLVVAYALAGTVRKNLAVEPIGTGSDGAPVFLKDIWPTNQEVRATVANGGNTAAAVAVGKRIAEKAKGLGIESVAFDRSGYQFHGRIKALAEAAREAGLKF